MQNLFHLFKYRDLLEGIKNALARQKIAINYKNFDYLLTKITNIDKLPKSK